MAKETKIIDKVDKSEEIIPFQYTITAYGADYPVDSLVKRIIDGDVFIPPFQREYRWDRKRASRFIESLLLGLPVPGIFLSREEGTNRLLVIDGNQRLRTLEYFYKGIFKDGKEFSLQFVQSQYLGATYQSISEDDRRILDNAILHATIVKQDKPSDDDSSIYHIFDRLNTGGVNLTAQELRACLYHGEFNDLLKNLNKNKDWRELFGPVSATLRDQELILRFLALYFVKPYSKPMADFLNKYMGKNRHLKLQSAEEISNLFYKTVEAINKSLGKGAFKPRGALIAAIFDAITVGIARRLEKGDIRDIEAVRQRYVSLLSNKRFAKVTETHTSDEENVVTRLAIATKAFADII
jgi:uncharacterized protein with ParB-like and HNH nuclease domain